MLDADHLFTVAEVGIALAGFSTLVAVLGVRPGRSDPRLDAFRLQVMLEASLFVVALSLFPLIPSKLGASADLTWRISAGVLLATDAILTAATLKRERAVRALYTRADRLLRIGAQAFAYTADLVAIFILLGVVGTLASGFYFVALYLNLVLAGLLFLRFAASIFVPRE